MKTATLLTALLCTYFTYSQIPTSDPLFPNSIVSTNIDFIKTTDPDTFTYLTYKGQSNKEMPGALSGGLFDSNTFVFEATFSNGKKVEIWCHSTFGNDIAAKEYVDKLVPRLGKLPEFMRDILSHVVIHNGDGGAFAESIGNFFVLYSENMDTRISNNDLEETVFHETVHATLDNTYLETNGWKQAQIEDRNYITDYAKSRSNKEDLAETAIFAYTMLKHPGRLAASTQHWVKTHIPNRLAYISNAIFSELILSTDRFSTQNGYSFDAFPNPTDNSINIFIKSSSKNDESLRIYDLTGRLVQSIKTRIGANIVPLKNFTSGIYFISKKGYKTTRIIKL